MNAFIDEAGEIIADQVEVTKENMKVLVKLSG